MRDLEYPADPERVVDSLLEALRFDASIAALGIRSQALPPPEEGPLDDMRFRASGVDDDRAVLREAPLLLSRFAVLQMLTHFEDHMNDLLLQRRVLEHLAPDQRMPPGGMWPVLKNVDVESREGPVAVTFGKVVAHPPEQLLAMRPWLLGLYAVRNCLAHRNGRVTLFDVAPDRKRLEETQDSDRLTATWPTMRVRVDGESRDLPFVHPGGDLEVSFETIERSWSIGERIHITPAEVQGICLALSSLTTEVLRGFQSEMDRIIGESQRRAAGEPPQA